MRIRATLGTVVAAFAVLTAAPLQFASLPAAEARAGGVIFQPHHIKTPPQIKAAPVDNVRDFGAVGDGVIDDTNAIQNAANDAAAHGKGVFFPAGTYLHASSITFNGVAVTGIGTGSILVANSVSGSPVILTGNGVSMQNMVVSTQSLAGPPPGPSTSPANLIVQNATSFTVANNTFVQGSNFWAVLVQTGSVGTITANVTDGAGGANDAGVVILQGANITVANNLMQNEAIGVIIVPFSSSPIPASSFFIAVISNTIGNTTFPTREIGIGVFGINVADIAGNTVQMADDSTFMSTPIFVIGCDDFQVVGNNTWGGHIGMQIQQSGPTGNRVTQNVIHNCGASGIDVENVAMAPFTSFIQIAGNAFGECGLNTPAPVINITGTGGPPADPSGATTFVQNNSYQGHLNNLTFLVQCTFTAPHIPAANVTGNNATQVVLSNSI